MPKLTDEEVAHEIRRYSEIDGVEAHVRNYNRTAPGHGVRTGHVILWRVRDLLTVDPVVQHEGAHGRAIVGVYDTVEAMVRDGWVVDERYHRGQAHDGSSPYPLVVSLETVGE